MKYLLAFSLGLLLVSSSYSQDVIIFHNGDMIESKIMEISDSEIKYKKYDNLDGPLYVVLKKDIFMINYSTGEKDIFERNSLSKDEKSNEKKNQEGTNYSRGTKILQANNLLAIDINNEVLSLNFGIGRFVSDNFAIIGQLNRLGAGAGNTAFTEIALTGLYYSNSGFFIGPSIVYDNYYEEVGLRLGCGYAIFLNESISIQPMIVTNVTEIGYNDPFSQFVIGGNLGIYLN